MSEDRKPLAVRFKEYEDSSRGIKVIDSYVPFLIRLDGCNFSAVTKKHFDKPFDERFSRTMVKTMLDVLEHFRARTAYVCSDEITLVFGSLCDWDTFAREPKKFTHLFGGRVDKLLSIIAAYTSLRFYVNLPPEIQEDMGHTALFDARLLLMPEIGEYFFENDEFMNHMIWRENDCRRNAISGYARYILGHKACTGLSGSQMIEAMDKVSDVPWSDRPTYVKRGCYGKLVKGAGPQVVIQKGYDPDAKSYIQTLEDPLQFLFQKQFDE